MALRSGGRKLSFDILAATEYEDLMSATADADAAAHSRSHSDPPPLQNGADSPSPRKRRKRKNRKGKASNSDSAIAETSVINGDVNYSCTLSTVTEVAAVVADLDSEVQQVTLNSVFRALRQRNVGSVEANSDDGGSSRKDDVAKEEVAENWSGGAKENGQQQQAAELNGRKLERDGTLDWKELMAEDPNYTLPMEKSPIKYFLEEVYAGNSLRSTTILGNDKERERVYDTIFRLPWRCELLINVGFFVCFDSFLSLLTIMPTRLIMLSWKLLRTSSRSLQQRSCLILVA